MEKSSALGERVATLEVQMKNLTTLMVEIETNLKSMTKWAWIALGVICGWMFATGAGTVSLKSLIDAIAK
jgi:hypothetical protein